MAMPAASVHRIACGESQSRPLEAQVQGAGMDLVTQLVTKLVFATHVQRM
jgi:hypothetical protein